MLQPKKVLVIGGNAAGPSAAAKAKRVNPNADVILFEAGEYISTGTCELPYLFSGEIKDYNQIVFFTPDTFYKEKGVKVFTNHFVKEIDSKNKQISVINKETNSTKNFDYDKLIITTGSKPIEIPQLPFTLVNVFSLKSVTDSRKIDGFLSAKKVNKVLVVGAGYIGLEVADSLNRAGFSVTILEKQRAPLPRSDEEVQALVYDLLLNNKLKFLSQEKNSKFVIKNNSLTQLKHDGLFIDFDFAIVAAGVKPNNSLSKDLNLRHGLSSGVLVDNRLKTSNPDIYAAGDIIEVKNFITRQNDYIPLATHAHSFGHIAGENAAGGNKTSDPVIPNAVFKFCGKYVAQVGLSLEKAEAFSFHTTSVSAVTNNKVKVMPNSSKVFGKIIFDKVTLQILGASFVGTEEVSGYADIISTMIYNKIPARNMANINFNYTPPLSPFVNLLSVLGRKIKEKF